MKINILDFDFRFQQVCQNGLFIHWRRLEKLIISTLSFFNFREQGYIPFLNDYSGNSIDIMETFNNSIIVLILGQTIAIIIFIFESRKK